MDILVQVGGLMLGVAIGYAFGAVQNIALLRNKQDQERKILRSGWTILPGSMGRVAILLAVLGLVQILCPLFFEGTSTQWLVSAGVMIGYGWTLVHQLRRHSTYRA